MFTIQKTEFWHTLDNRYEVDAVIGEAEMAIEVKSSSTVSSNDTKGLKAFFKEFPQAKRIIVCREAMPRLFNGIEIWPVELFLQRLWHNKMIVP